MSQRTLALNSVNQLNRIYTKTLYVNILNLFLSFTDAKLAPHHQGSSLWTRFLSLPSVKGHLVLTVTDLPHATQTFTHTQLHSQLENRVACSLGGFEQAIV